jgi:hypothetical protein
MGDDPFVIPPPQAVYPLEAPSRSLHVSTSRQKACTIIASHADVAFAVASVLVFIGPTKESLIHLRHDLRAWQRQKNFKKSTKRTKDARKALKESLIECLVFRQDMTEEYGDDFDGEGGGGMEADQTGGSPGGDPDTEEQDEPFSYQVQLQLSAVRVLLTDPTLGLHLPLLKLCLGDVYAFVSQMPEADHEDEESKQPTKVDEPAALTLASPRREAAMGGLYVSFVIRIWTDYFNNALKCWEPLLEPFLCRILYEQNGMRGMGVTATAKSPLLINVSSAFLQTVSYISQLVGSLQGNIFQNEQKFLLLFTTVYEGEIVKVLGGGVSLRPSAMTTVDEYQVDEVSVLEGAEKGARQGRPVAKMVVHHQFPKPLAVDARKPFAIYNLTGQRIRYFQAHLGEESATVEYLRNGEKGELSFGATMTVLRNLRTLEVPFDVQRDLTTPADYPAAVDEADSKYDDAGASERHEHKKAWSVAVQVSGYRWLPSISADALGVTCEDLHPLIGQLHVQRLLNDWRLTNALKLVSEVRLHNGCRQLTLRSVFRVKNCTKHDLILVALPNPASKPILKDVEEELKSAPPDGSDALHRGTTYTPLKPGGVWHVPLLLLHLATTLDGAATAHLGKLWVRPYRWAGSLRSRKDEVQFSTEPIDLKEVVFESAKLVDPQHPTPADSNGRGYHLVCPIMRGSHSNPASSPPISYCVEVVRTKVAAGKGVEKDEVGEYPSAEAKATDGHASGTQAQGAVRANRRHRGMRGKKEDHYHGPIEYLILIHPPLVLENLLPEICDFELRDLKTNTLLWKDRFSAGQAVPVHNVRLDYPLLLVIQTGYCRSPEGALIHRGDLSLVSVPDEVAKSITLVDFENKKLVLGLNHQVGGAGQRRVTVYCPYWLVNMTNCFLVYRQEGKSSYPAGTILKVNEPPAPTRPVVADRELSTPYDERKASRSPPPDREPDRGREDGSFIPMTGPGRSEKRHKQFPGPQGLERFHDKVLAGLRTNTASVSTRFTDSFDLLELCNASFMFNFGEDTVLVLGHRRLQIRVNESAWSKGFSLDTVGVNQVITVRHPFYGNFDLSLVINLAPGRLGQYTKVVYFCPRYVLWNRHSQPVWLAQESPYFSRQEFLYPRRQEANARQESTYVRHRPITDTVKPGDFTQVHVPYSSERRVFVQLDGGYDKSAPFLIDEGADICLKVTRQTDLTKMKHLMTRKAPEYEIFLPPRQEIGLWLETTWNQENICVKDVKKNKWAFEQTEIQKGDVLLAIAGEPTAYKKFKEVLTHLRELLSTQGALVRFRTHEENMRLIRMRALKKSPADPIQTTSMETHGTRAEKVIRVDGDRGGLRLTKALCTCVPGRTRVRFGSTQTSRFKHLPYRQVFGGGSELPISSSQQNQKSHYPLSTSPVRVSSLEHVGST